MMWRTHGWVVLLLALCLQGTVCERSFRIDKDNNTFLKDGRPFRIVSGSIHYFRVLPQDWEDRLTKLKYAGFNAVQTYIEWSSHEAEPGVYDFTGGLNFTDFIAKAQALDLLVIIRPGPFIDAERDFGGLPYWLLQTKYIQIRSSDTNFLKYMDRWYNKLFPMLKPQLYSEGGPVIMVQVENEYGSYGCDFYYTSHIRDLMRQTLGNDILLYTTDGANPGMLKCGRVAETYATVDFGPGPLPAVEFNVQRLFEPRGPLMNSEFYPGWLDHWGKPHSKVAASYVATFLDLILRQNASVNLYMAHGGTSFGLKSGANIDSGEFEACPTSYDYDAPISEAGDLTEKYWAIRKTISKYEPLPDMPQPKNSSKSSYGKVEVKVVRTLWEAVKNMSHYGPVVMPTSFEELKYDNGLVIYEHVIKFNTTDPAVLSVTGVNDRAYVYLDTEYVGTLTRQYGILQLPLTAREGQKLSIIVESLGRVCFGPDIKDSKGLVGPVKLGGRPLYTWLHTPVELMPCAHQGPDCHSGKTYNSSDATARGELMWYHGNFTVDDPNDTFMRLDGWSKGFAWVNGFMLGRYWPNVGPQVTLYVPGRLLQPGRNMLMLMELQESPCAGGQQCHVELVDSPAIDGPVPQSYESKCARRST